LELALAGVPSVAAYRIPALEGLLLRSMAKFHPLIKARSVILANLVLGEYAIPEFLQRQCTVANVAPAFADILDDTPARQRQIEAFGRLDAILDTGGRAPSTPAAGGAPGTRGAEAGTAFRAQRQPPGGGKSTDDTRVRGLAVPPLPPTMSREPQPRARA